MIKKELIEVLSQVDDDVDVYFYDHPYDQYYLINKAYFDGSRIVLSEECDHDLMMTCEKKQDWTTSNDFGPPFVV